MKKSAYSQRLALVCFLMGMTLAAWTAAPVLAATLTVTTTTDRDNGSYTPGDASLREAVKYAGGNDTVEFAVNGIFPLTMGEIEINKNLTINGKNLSVSDSLTQISGGGVSRVFNITSGTVTIKNLVITQGYTDLDPGGGGILNDAFLTLDTVRIANCTASYKHGGGLRSHGNLTIKNCHFSGNQTVGGYGGGGLNVYRTGGVNPTVNISDTYFGSNDAGSGGAGISTNRGDVTITRCVFENNDSTTSGSGGGALNLYISDIIINDSTFDSNTCTRNGGAIYASSATVLAINGSTFSANRSRENGGALYIVTVNLDIVNSTFSGNQAEMSGGAMWLSPLDVQPAEVSFTTITENWADADCGDFGATCSDGNGGGMYLEANTAHLRGVVLAQNFIDTGSAWAISDCAAGTGAFNSQGYNLIGSNAGCLSAFPDGLPNINHDYVGTAGVPLSPLLGDLEDHGGPTETCRPGLASLAYNRGPLDCCDTSGNPVLTDQRGLGRASAGRADIGAHERSAGGGAHLGMLME